MDRRKYLLAGLLIAAAATVGWRKSHQNVRLIVGPQATDAVKRGTANLPPLDSYHVPWLFKHSYAQLFLLIMSWKTAPKLDQPNFREVVRVRNGDEVLLDWFTPSGADSTTPIVIYIPGITGQLAEATNFIRHVLSKNYVAVVFHRRGHEQPLKEPTFNVFGNAHDLRAALETIRVSNPDTPIALVGSSAGSAVMVRYLGEFGSDSLVQCAVGLSPGYDIENMWKRIEGSFLDRYLVSRLKEFFVEKNESILRERCAETVETLKQANSMHEFTQAAGVFSSDDVQVKRSYDEWLITTCPLRVAENVATPTLCLNSLDDGICIGEIVNEIGVNLPQKNPHCALLVTDNGSHCAHQSVSPNGGFENWGHVVALDFIKGVIDQ